MSEENPSTAKTATAASSLDLAKLRSSLALERTLLAWIRTSLTLICFGFTLTKFMHDLIKTGHWQSELQSPKEIGLAMMSLGIIGLIGGLLDYSRRIKRIQEGTESPIWTASFLVAAALIALSIFTMINLIVGIYS